MKAASIVNEAYCMILIEAIKITLLGTHKEKQIPQTFT